MGVVGLGDSLVRGRRTTSADLVSSADTKTRPYPEPGVDDLAHDGDGNLPRRHDRATMRWTTR